MKRRLKFTRDDYYAIAHGGGFRLNLMSRTALLDLIVWQKRNRAQRLAATRNRAQRLDATLACAQRWRERRGRDLSRACEPRAQRRRSPSLPDPPQRAALITTAPTHAGPGSLLRDSDGVPVTF